MSGQQEQGPAVGDPVVVVDGRLYRMTITAEAEVVHPDGTKD